MSEPNIIKNMSLKLVELIGSGRLVEEKFFPKVVVSFDKKLSKPYVYLYLYSIDENSSLKGAAKSIHTHIDEKGEAFEYYLDPPIYLDLKYMVTVFADSSVYEQMVLGAIAKLLHENNTVIANIETAEDLNAKSEKISIRSTAALPIETQIELARGMGEIFRPSLFYQITVKIWSEKKTGFKKVLSRHILLKPERR